MNSVQDSREVGGQALGFSVGERPLSEAIGKGATINEFDDQVGVAAVGSDFIDAGDSCGVGGLEAGFFAVV